MDALATVVDPAPLVVDREPTAVDPPRSVAIVATVGGFVGTALPPHRRGWREALRHPRLMQYHRLIALVVAANVVVTVWGLTSGWWSRSGSRPMALGAMATAAQANLVLAVVPRQQFVVNVVGWLATRPGLRWPLRWRWALGKYYHLGGVHVGAAVSGTWWYSLFVVSLGVEFVAGGRVSVVNVAISAIVVAVLVAMSVLALPGQRARHHDRFELSHRLGGWSVVLLVWVNTVVFVGSQRAGGSMFLALATAPTVWLLAATSVGAVWPWLLLRRVPVTVERPSAHVALVRLDHGVTPPVGTTRAISRSPVAGWHHFANVPAAGGEAGYRMVVSRAGDWTGAFIDDPPSHVWVRGVPTVGVANVKRLFERVVFVVTGSGIGPALGHLLTAGPGTRLVWVTRDPARTYGDGLWSEVAVARPDAWIWNTDTHGKPDVLELAYRAYLDAGAEAVICISNKAVTWQVVHGLERRGIPAFGPIWDS